MFVINTRIVLKMSITSQNPVSVFVVFILFISHFLASISHAKDTITQGESIKDGETIVSQNGEFSMGFFSPENSESRYMGIWYSNKTPALLWVANRETPISDKTGVLTIGIDGKLLVLDGNNKSIWSSNVSSSSNNNTAMLENTGNLYLSSTQDAGDVNKAYWQSFNNPTDTFLPGMRVRVNAAMGENRAFTSWTSTSDPSSGKYSLGIDPRGSPQIVMWEGLRRRWRSGHWNAVIFTGVPNMTNNYLYGFKLSSKEADGSMYFTYNPSNTFDVLRFLLTWDGKEEQRIWDEEKNEWIVMQSQPANDCELYNKCGDFGVCSVKKSPLCSCMKGFVPKDLDQWHRGNWSGGCVRRTPLKCGRNGNLIEEIGGGDGFREVKCAKLPDFVDSVTVDGAGACRDKCLRNCSCNAYASVAGIGCMMWSMNLADVQEFEKGGQTFYIRLASSELGGKKKISNFLIAVIVVTGTIFLCLCIWLLWRFRFRVNKKACSVSCRTNNELPLFDPSKSLDFSTEISLADDLVGERKQVAGPDLPLFNFSIVALATNNFDAENKLGQGGFGPVYRGKLPGGQDIAVKRLSRRSNQGLEEFKNEMILIAKLQHRNLVRLLGCCIEGEEKMLLYEYMPNKSLDYFLFDTTRQSLLDWTKRFEIIEGIARGLLYLHRDSRLRIIHRDLKASNILLDEEMNPKISDFGLARIFGGNQNEANTNRVVGTYGYMSPEYAMEGLFSVKSDVYSFGVLLLEVLSGLRNNSFRSSEHSNLIRYAWHLWTEGKAVELIDPSIADSCPQDEALKCIHVGMLCVQDLAANRPTMSSVVLMLETEMATLPMPRQPTFTSMRNSIDTDTFTDQGQDIVSSSNDMTVTVVVGR